MLSKILFALTITLVPVKLSKPTLVRQGGEHYRAVNPLRVPVTMRIECMGEYEPFTVPVPAGSALELDIRLPSGHAATCLLVGWE